MAHTIAGASRAALFSVAAALGRPADSPAPSRRLGRRAAPRRELALDDRTLRDIGLTRADLDALSL